MSTARACNHLDTEQHGAGRCVVCLLQRGHLSTKLRARRSLDEGDVRRIKEQKLSQAWSPSVERAGQQGRLLSAGPQPVLCRLCSCCSQLVSLPGRSPSCSLRPEPGWDGGSTAMVLLLPTEPHPGAESPTRRLATQLGLCLILP